MEIGLFAPHEQHHPTHLRDIAERAERAGFDSVWTSDHFHPWWHSDAECGAVWPWLGAALERTERVRIGTGVTAPIARYHPALIAQAVATLESMYPGRHYLTFATGEALNERPLGFEWPSYEERKRRLIDACEIVGRLWDGGFHDYDGHYWDLDTARLYTLPDQRPPLYVAGNGPETTTVAGRYADGFLTLVDIETYQDELVPAIERGAAEAGRDPDEVKRIKQASVAFAEECDAAVDALEFWSGSQAVGFEEEIYDPREIEARGESIPEGERVEWGLVTTDPAEVEALIDRHEAAGFDEIELLVTTPDLEHFVDVMDETVLDERSITIPEEQGY